ncbi:hypothetical protein [Streptomyces yangpuensis]|uniref:hypothetical protein n=1 Tax=Streptomyces yangpuensis TaxID=1648182 RepID=UPI003649C760
MAEARSALLWITDDFIARATDDGADAFEDLDTRVRVRGHAPNASGCEGAADPVAGVFADQTIALSNRPSLGLLNAVFGKAHTAALRDDRTTARRLLAEGRRIFDRAGSRGQTSDCAIAPWRLNVFISLLARLGDETATVTALPRFATHLQKHRGLMPVRSGDVAAGTAYARAALDVLPRESTP